MRFSHLPAGHSRRRSWQGLGFCFLLLIKGGSGLEFRVSG